MSGIARKISPEVRGAALYELHPAFEFAGEVHERVIVGSMFGESHIFPTFGRPRVLGEVQHFAPAALASIGYEVVR